MRGLTTVRVWLHRRAARQPPELATPRRLDPHARPHIDDEEQGAGYQSFCVASFVTKLTP
jgi:hypothetical protein